MMEWLRARGREFTFERAALLSFTILAISMAWNRHLYTAAEWPITITGALYLFAGSMTLLVTKTRGTLIKSIAWGAVAVSCLLLPFVTDTPAFWVVLGLGASWQVYREARYEHD